MRRRLRGRDSPARRGLLAAAAAVVLTGVAFGAVASEKRTPSAAPPAASAPTLEPKALAILKAASATLSAAKALSFTAVSTYERAARNGQPLYYSSVQDVTMERPDKLRVITPGDGVPDEFYYDGRTMTAYVPSTNMAAVADAPPTLDKLLDEAWEKAAIYFPFADLLAADPYEGLSKRLKSAFYVGRSIAVGGVPTDMIAIAGDDAAAEIWIGVADHLPRQIRAVYANEPAHARYQTVFSDWRLDPSIPPGTFSSAQAAKAERIEFAPPGNSTAPADVSKPSAAKKP